MAQRTHKPAVNTAAVNTYEGVVGVKHLLCGIEASFSGTGAPTLTGLKVESPAGTIIWQVELEAANKHGQLYFDPAIEGAEGQALIVTLAAGGANAIGCLNSRTRS